jgi:oxalate decarboxylase/phosphoglucose isomerase-like protein (cupin superfamily)
METINGCTVVSPSDAPEPMYFGPAETQGAYVVIVGAFPPGQTAPPLHVHPHTDEAFYIGDGNATFLLGDREVPATAGGLVFVPRGMAHTVWNSGDRPLHGLIVVSPGDAEHLLVPVEAGRVDRRSG